MRRHSMLLIWTSLCIMAAAFGTRYDGRSARASSEAGAPALAIPVKIPAAGPGVVSVPIHYSSGGKGVAGLAFSLDYDAACLSIDLVNSQPAPGAVTFHVPMQFNASVSYDPLDSEGKLDIVIADYALPISTLMDSAPLLTVTFRVLCAPAKGQTIVTPVRFSVQPPPSFSNSIGRPIPGQAADGSVAVQSSLPGGPTPTPGPTPKPSNFAPSAVDDAATTRIGQQVTLNVLANDTDLDGDTLAVVEATQPGLGEVTLGANGRVTYRSTSDRSGSDVFRYVAGDDKGGLATASVWVTVLPANRPPVAVNDRAVTRMNTPVTVNVLANDYDVDPLAANAQVGIGVVGQPLHGSTALTHDGRVIYTPHPGFTGEDAFVYAAVDAEGGGAVATVTVKVQSVDDPPSGTGLDLAGFSLAGYGGHVQARWATRGESDLLGYYLLRTAGPQLAPGTMDLPYRGAWVRVSPLLPSLGDAGGNYSFLDESAQPNVQYAYMLVALSRTSAVDIFGPQTISAAPGEFPAAVWMPLLTRSDAAASP